MLRRRPAFTLVELLVVIGIMALLISILLPALNRSREIGNRIACLSNLRQMGTVLMMYATDNNGFFPNAANGVQSDADWIYWQAGRDREQGRLVAYLGGSFADRHYMCPSDLVAEHPGTNPYPFSYTLNARIGGAHDSETTYYPLFHPTRFSEIIRPSEKILMIDESVSGIDDGAWAPSTLDPEQGHSHNMLSNRHDRNAEKITDAAAGKGNAIFADGHGDFVERKMCLMVQHVDPKWR